MATSKKSTGKKLKDPTSFVAVTRVSLSVRQVNGEVKKIQGICGHGLERPLANYDPDTQSWKMFGDISLWGDCPLLVNLPVSGMTRSGVLFLQHPWEPITGETESSLWPTPKASDAKRGDSPSERNRHTPCLPAAVNMWPTPTASDWKGRGPNSKQQGLPEVVKTRGNLWPTPTTADTFTPKSRSNPTLGDAARASTYPTPTHGKMAGGTGAFNKVQELFTQGQITDEERKSMQAGNGGKLNPTWVEWLMGFPLGWTDLED
jgi:DNA (cytosine-5)-methyltransferase 1